MKNFKKFLREYKMSFTLAEVVIVMAILSIMMVAFAPVVTKKTSSTSDTFRTFTRTNGNYGVYYGTTKDTKPVVIGSTFARAIADADDTGVYPKMFLVATTNRATETSSTHMTPQVAFITGNKNNNLQYAAGQLLITGGLITSNNFNDSSNEYFISLLPSYLLTQPAFADEETQAQKTQYMNPAHRGITVILGGKPNAAYRAAIGDKKMTIIGGNACENAEGTGVMGLICIGADAASSIAYSSYGSNAIIIGTLDSTSIPNNTVFIGHNAGGYNLAEGGIYIGDYAMNNVGMATFAQRVYFGPHALSQYICQLATGNPLVSGSSNRCYAASNAGTHQDLGKISQTQTTAYNDNALIKLAFDTTATETLIPSDERLKNVSKSFTAGLDAINKIEPVNFTYKRDENKFPHVGVIAQALAPIFPNAISTNKDGYFYIRTEDMFYAAINAIKELYQMYLAHDKKLQILTERSAVLEKQNKELMELYTELSKRVEKLDKKRSKDITLTPMPVYNGAEDVKPETDEE